MRSSFVKLAGLCLLPALAAAAPASTTACDARLEAISQSSVALMDEFGAALDTLDLDMQRSNRVDRARLSPRGPASRLLVWIFGLVRPYAALRAEFSRTPKKNA